MSGLRRILLATALALACVLAFAPPALAKDFHIASIDMRAQVSQDGTMTITETRHVTFNGNYHWAQWALNKKGSEGIELVRITGPDGKEMRPSEGAFDPETGSPGTGLYDLTDEGTRLVLKVGFDVTDATVPFVLEYRVLGAAKRWADTSELFWQFIGTETDVVTDKVHVDVILPPGVQRSQMRAWAHGPLNGVVAIAPDGGSVTLDVTELPPNTFVEGRVLFPADALPTAPLIDKPRAAAVAAEEAALANEANRVRTQARVKVASAYVVGLVLPFVLLGVVVMLWYRYGKEYKPRFPGGYFRDIPADIAPPLVGALWRMGQPEDRDIGATMMDLSLKGAIYMRPVVEQDPGGFLGIGAHSDSTYELTVNREKLAQADPYERDIANFLFDDTMRSDSFTIEQLRDEAKAHPREFTNGLSAWKASVAARADQLGWIEKQGKGAQVVAFLLSVVAGGASVVTLFSTGLWPIALGIVAAVVAFVLSFLVTRRSREAVELYAKYQGLERYMKDFGRMQEKPPSSVVLWEQYLVLAVVFGIAEEVIQQMRVAVPEVVNDPTFATAYWWAYPASGSGSSPVSSVSVGMAAAVSAATSAMSSSSGGGGGFSGGGGGGGGGGGFSAG